MGAMKAQLGLEPITTENKNFQEIKSLINDRFAVVTSEKRMEKTKVKLE